MKKKPLVSALQEVCVCVNDRVWSRIHLVFMMLTVDDMTCDVIVCFRSERAPAAGVRKSFRRGKWVNWTSYARRPSSSRPRSESVSLYLSLFDFVSLCRLICVWHHSTARAVEKLHFHLVVMSYVSLSLVFVYTHLKLVCVNCCWLVTLWHLLNQKTFKSWGWLFTYFTHSRRFFL